MTQHAADLSQSKLTELCKDPMWRIRNLYWVRNKDGDAVPFRPWEEQLKFLNSIWYRNIIPKARQRGFSTVVQLMMLDACLFVPFTAAAIIAQDKPTASKIFDDKIQFTWNRLPEAIRAGQPLTTDTKTEMQWANESSLYVSTSTRGTTLQYLHVSELGIIAKKFPHKVKEIVTGSLPSVDQTGIIVIESTVESPDDKFSEMVKTAERNKELGKKLAKQEYRLHFASWWDADEYQSEPDGVVFTKKDKDYFYRIEGEIGRKISLPRRAWYVLKRENDFSGNEEDMWSQYPSTLKEAFNVASEGRWLSKQMAVVRNTGRIMDIPHRPDLPVITVWDLGTEDDMAIWCGQEDGPWMNWINFFEGSNEPYEYFVNWLQSTGYTWSRHLLPHDGDKRQQGADRLRTPKDILGGLRLKNIETVPRIAAYTVGVNQLRTAFSTYRFDRTNCAEGIKHLDGYAKVWSESDGRFTSQFAKNGHQHAPDALRQHAQWKHNLIHNPEGGRKPNRRNKRGMAA